MGMRGACCAFSSCQRLMIATLSSTEQPETGMFHSRLGRWAGQRADVRGLLSRKAGEKLPAHRIASDTLARINLLIAPHPLR